MEDDSKPLHKEDLSKFLNQYPPPNDWKMLYLGGNVENIIVDNTIFKENEKKDEKMTFILANYNNEPYLLDCLNSIVKQTSNKWNCLIIDDKSTDNSINVINDFLNKQNDNRFTLLLNENNLGYTNTLKKLVKESKTDIVCILDPDDTIESNCCEEFLKEYSKGNRGFVYSNFWYCDEKLKIIKKGTSRYIPRGKSNIDYDCIYHCKSFRRSIYNLTDGFDENILYAEDKDIIFKLEEVTKPYFIPQELYKYRFTEKGQGSGGDKKKMNIGMKSFELAKQNAIKRRNQKKWFKVKSWCTCIYYS